MQTIKFFMTLMLVMLVGGIVLQAMGYIDSPLFEWFTKVDLFYPTRR